MEHKCYNCDTETNKTSLNVDTRRILKKYKNIYLCTGCYECLLLFGYLGETKNPSVIYEKEQQPKINFKKSK
jgi:hypothetical protein